MLFCALCNLQEYQEHAQEYSLLFAVIFTDVKGILCIVQLARMSRTCSRMFTLICCLFNGCKCFSTFDSLLSKITKNRMNII